MFQLACELRVLARNGEQLLLILGIPVAACIFGNVDILPTGDQTSINTLRNHCLGNHNAPPRR